MISRLSPEPWPEIATLSCGNPEDQTPPDWTPTLWVITAGGGGKDCCCWIYRNWNYWSTLVITVISYESLVECLRVIPIWMQIWMSYLYRFKILFFLFKTVHYHASGFILFLPASLFYKTLFFSRVLLYTRTHSENVIMLQWNPWPTSKSCLKAYIVKYL